jgi:hypothetical protein
VTFSIVHDSEVTGLRVSALDAPTSHLRELRLGSGVLGDQTNEVVQEFASRAFRQLVLFGQACGELVERNRTVPAMLSPYIRPQLRAVGKRYDSELEGNRLFAASVFDRPSHGGRPAGSCVGAMGNNSTPHAGQAAGHWACKR